MAKMRLEIGQHHKNEDGSLKFKEFTCTNNLSAQFLVLRLTEANIPFRIINLGAGLKKITTETDICPKCKGTGRC